MPDAELSVAVLWADPDLLAIQVSVRFDPWSGSEQAYVTRSELTEFAKALDRVAGGGSEAVLAGGQRDLSYAELRVFEYGGARRLGMDILLGSAAGRIINEPSHPLELRLSVPFERGQLPSFTTGLRSVVAAETGEARLPLLQGWP
jgi:hypothetical protein